MEAIQDGVLAFLAAVGLSTLVWMLGGWLFRRERPELAELRLLLPLRGDAEALEAQMRALRQMQSQLPGAQIVLLDCGLTERARSMADYLTRREAGAALCRWKMDTQETGERKSDGDGDDVLRGDRT